MQLERAYQQVADTLLYYLPIEYRDRLIDEVPKAYATVINSRNAERGYRHRLIVDVEVRTERT